jgi:hypothetical protein
MESQSLDQKFNTILKPKLEESGFTRVNLKGCMCPEYLYNNGRLWFDLSWDWRDRYLEVGLGHLHWFKDVMERVVVVGDYSCYMNQITYDAIDRIGSAQSRCTRRCTTVSFKTFVPVGENETKLISMNILVKKYPGMNYRDLKTDKRMQSDPAKLGR